MGLLVNQKVVRINKDRKFIYQFLPICLEDISKSQTLVFDGNRLKSNYIIDIVHNLLLKYYFKNQNSFPLSSKILRKRYGAYYSKYISFLLKNEIIILDKNYLKGSNSRIYSLSYNIIHDTIIRFRNKDKFLLKKNSEISDQFEVGYNNIDDDIKLKLISDLKFVNIDFEKSIFYLEDDKDDINFNRNLYSIESIREGYIFHHFDKYGRLHTNFTILKSLLRKNCLTIDGEETFEIDINNSQPFFLSKLILSMGSNWIDPDEMSLFSELVDSGSYYQFIMDRLDLSKENSKNLTYKVLFGRNRRTSPSDIMFRSLFPTIHKFIVLYKNDYSDYRVLSHHLQRMESDIIFNKIIRRIIDINPDIHVVTIHDSIIVSKKWETIVSSVFKDEISKIQI